MSGWNDPRFIITVLLIALFGAAYASDPSDQAMKGAIIGAFSAAYGFWIGSAQQDKRTENTGKALDAIRAAQESTPTTHEPTDVNIVSQDKPVDVTETPPQASPDGHSAPSRPSVAPDSPPGAGGAPRGSEAALPEYAR